MREAKGGKIATVISVLALLVSFAALRLQLKQREDRIADRAEVLEYEIGSERVDPKQWRLGARPEEVSRRTGMGGDASENEMKV